MRTKHAAADTATATLVEIGTPPKIRKRPATPS